MSQKIFFLLISLEWLHNILKDCILLKLTSLIFILFFLHDSVCVTGLIFPVMAASQFEGFV